MTEQLDLWSTEQRDAAIQTVDEHANALWKWNADEAIKALAQQREMFTTDHVIAYMELRGQWDETHEPKALGPRMLAASNRGLIVNTGTYAASRRGKSHNRRKLVWRSLMVYDRR